MVKIAGRDIQFPVHPIVIFYFYIFVGKET
jgi:hypothetical protein